MKLKCNPVHKKGDRNIFCPYYGKCLDNAVEKFWEDWDCGECQYRTRQDARKEIQFTIRGTIPYYEVIIQNNYINEY